MCVCVGEGGYILFAKAVNFHSPPCIFDWTVFLSGLDSVEAVTFAACVCVCVSVCGCVCSLVAVQSRTMVYRDDSI